MLGSRVVVGGAVLCAWLFSCSGSESHEFDCAVGSLNCSCGADDHCKEGLVCNPRNQCVKPSSGSAGDGGGADGGRAGTSSSGGSGKGSGKAGKGQGKGGVGAGATGGSSSGEGGGGAAGDPSGGTGGTAVSGAAGDGPAGSGGESGQPGSGGTLGGGAGGTAGAGAASGLGGTSGAGGSVAGAGGSVAGAGGLGGTGGVGGTEAGAAGMSGGEAGAAGAAGGSGKCTEIALPSTMSLRNYTDAPSYFRYDYQTTKNVGEGDADFVTLAFWNVGIFDGGATGKFTLGAGSDDNTATCSRCVLGEQDRKTGTSVVFFASSGEMEIADGSDQMNGFPVVTLTDVTLTEVTISDSGISTPVPNGRCWHLASASIEFPKAWTCDATYYAGRDGCDCGCGTLDGDCAGSAVSDCDWCYCPGDALDCGTNSVVKDDNALCE